MLKKFSFYPCARCHAIDLCKDACGKNGKSRFITIETVNQAFSFLDTESRNFDLLSNVLLPTANHDPTFGK